MKLPGTLARWHPLLDVFQAELQPELARMASALELAIGRPRVNSSKAADEPSGFDGLSRRGTYERLLLTEWLMAEEAPLEFVRRAAGGEHSFLRLAHDAPRGEFHTAAIFDAGPEQLGTPRIAHLAALIVLARRAENAKGSLVWCVAQQPDATYSLVDRATLENLLDGRSALETNIEQVQHARQVMERAAAMQEIWLIGGEHCAAIAAELRMNHLQVTDVLEPGAHQLEISVRQGRMGTARRIVLDLPPDAVCTRLLRDPFAASPTLPAVTPTVPRPNNSTVVTSNPIFIGTRGVATIGKYPHILLYSYIRNGLNDAHRKMRSYAMPSRHALIAATREQNAIVGAWWIPYRKAIGVGALNGRKVVDMEGTFSAEVLAPQVAMHLSNGTLSKLWRARTDDDSMSWYLLLNNRMLVRLDSTTRSAVVVNEAVHALQLDGTCTHYLSIEDEHTWRYTTMSEKFAPEYSHLARTNSQACLGRCMEFKRDIQGMVAMRVNEDEWDVQMPTGCARIRVGKAWPHFAVAPDGAPEPTLLVQRGGRSLSLVREHDEVVLPQAAENIAHVAVDHRNNLIAYTTTGGAIGVYSMTLQRMLFEFDASTRHSSP